MVTSKIIFGIIGAVLIIGSGFMYLSRSGEMTDAQKDAQADLIHPDADMMEGDKDEHMTASNTPMKDDAVTKGEEMTIHAGSYIAYAPELIASSALKGKVVLFFHASWCPTCRNLDKDIKAHLQDIPGDLTILDVDYDKSAELKKKYGVTYQHTFVEVDANGTLIKKWSGSPTLATLVAEVK